MITSALILTARAADPLKDAADQFTDLDANQLVQIFLTIASWFLVVVGLIAVVMVLWSAFQFITAGGGNEEQLSKAKKTLIYSIVGVVVAILAFSIVTFTSSILSSSGGGGPGGTSCLFDSNCPAGQTCKGASGGPGGGSVGTCKP